MKHHSDMILNRTCRLESSRVTCDCDYQMTVFPILFLQNCIPPAVCAVIIKVPLTVFITELTVTPPVVTVHWNMILRYTFTY